MLDIGTRTLKCLQVNELVAMGDIQLPGMLSSTECEAEMLSLVCIDWVGYDRGPGSNRDGMGQQ